MSLLLRRNVAGAAQVSQLSLVDISARETATTSTATPTVAAAEVLATERAPVGSPAGVTSPEATSSTSPATSTTASASSRNADVVAREQAATGSPAGVTSAEYSSSSTPATSSSASGVAIGDAIARELAATATAAAVAAPAEVLAREAAPSTTATSGASADASAGFAGATSSGGTSANAGDGLEADAGAITGAAIASVVGLEQERSSATTTAVHATVAAAGELLEQGAPVGGGEGIVAGELADDASPATSSSAAADVVQDLERELAGVVTGSAEPPAIAFVAPEAATDTSGPPVTGEMGAVVQPPVGGAGGAAVRFYRPRRKEVLLEEPVPAQISFVAADLEVERPFGNVRGVEGPRVLEEPPPQLRSRPRRAPAKPKPLDRSRELAVEPTPATPLLSFVAAERAPTHEMATTAIAVAAARSADMLERGLAVTARELEPPPPRDAARIARFDLARTRRDQSLAFRTEHVEDLRRRRGAA